MTCPAYRPTITCPDCGTVCALVPEHPTTRAAYYECQCGFSVWARVLGPFAHDFPPRSPDPDDGVPECRLCGRPQWCCEQPDPIDWHDEAGTISCASCDRLWDAWLVMGYFG